VREGDAAEVGTVFDRHHARVLAHCRRWTDSKVDAEDLTPRVFLEALRRAESVRFVDASALPWLLVVPMGSIGSVSGLPRQPSCCSSTTAPARRFLADAWTTGWFTDPQDAVCPAVVGYDAQGRQVGRALLPAVLGSRNQPNCGR
jgi:hypothetical protein